MESAISAFNDSLPFVIRYLNAYTQAWCYQSFNTIERAQSMVDFYRSCGSPAELVIW